MHVTERMIKLTLEIIMKMKYIAILTMMLMCLIGFTTSAGTCSASPHHCNEEATVYVPPGGSCVVVIGDCIARVTSYDANGMFVDAHFVFCPIF